MYGDLIVRCKKWDAFSIAQNPKALATLGKRPRPFGDTCVLFSLRRSLDPVTGLENRFAWALECLATFGMGGHENLLSSGNCL
jgi:hypothetical protein